MAKDACDCKVELNHLNSMQLMFMEAIGEGRKANGGATFYRDATIDAIGSVGKCVGVDISAPVSMVRETTQYIESGEVRPAMRLMQDAFWHTLFRACAREAK